VIKRPTVLVLGAGASAPFGFPSGRKLRDDIIAGLRKETAQPFQLLTAAGFDVNHVASFRDALRRSGQPSVDVFLEYRPEFIPVGKVAVAASLIPYEDETKLWSGDDNWYEHLWKHLGPSLMDDIAQSHLSVVTFNYDRSLEQFLFSALRRRNCDTRDRHLGRPPGVYCVIASLSREQARPQAILRLQFESW
jgi:hypothetical protein